MAFPFPAPTSKSYAMTPFGGGLSPAAAMLAAYSDGMAWEAPTRSMAIKEAGTLVYDGLLDDHPSATITGSIPTVVDYIEFSNLKRYKLPVGVVPGDPEDQFTVVIDLYGGWSNGQPFNFYSDVNTSTGFTALYRSAGNPWFFCGGPGPDGVSITGSGVDCTNTANTFKAAISFENAVAARTVAGNNLVSGTVGNDTSADLNPTLASLNFGFSLAAGTARVRSFLYIPTASSAVELKALVEP